MDFYPMYNAFMSTNPKCKLRQKEGYVKSTNVGGTGRKGYIRSVAMTARNVEECRERSDHTRRNSGNIGPGVLEQIDVSWNEWNFFLREARGEPECVPGGSRVGGPSRDVHIQGYHSAHLLSHRPSLEQT